MNGCSSKRLAYVIVLGLALGVAPTAGAYPDPHPAADSCWNVNYPMGGGQAGNVPLPYFGETEVGSPCGFRAQRSGGYKVVQASTWRIEIIRQGRIIVLSSGKGSPPCADAAIARADRVTVQSDGAVHVGLNAAC